MDLQILDDTGKRKIGKLKYMTVHFIFIIMLLRRFGGVYYYFNAQPICVHAQDIHNCVLLICFVGEQ